MATAIINDDEFGDVSIRYYQASRSLRFRLTPKGKLVISAPLHTSRLSIVHALKNNRPAIRHMIEDSRQDLSYTVNATVGKSHRLVFVNSNLETKFQVYTKERTIYVNTNDSTKISSKEIQAQIQKEVIKALRKEAKAYLPRRLQHLARKFGYSYQSTRLTHAGTRWGSCSSRGTISLNIALMKLDIELIDYVLIHELCHTREMNHSDRFWHLVSLADPDYRLHRRLLKNQSPAL